MEISKYWIMRVEVGGKKNLIVNGWVRHWGVGGGVDLKMGNPFQSNFGFWCHKRYLTKLQPFDPKPQKYSASVFQNLHKIHFSRYFSMFVGYFSNKSYE